VFGTHVNFNGQHIRNLLINSRNMKRIYKNVKEHSAALTGT